VIERYSTTEMTAVWSDEAKLATWVEVETAVCRAWAARGVVPSDALRTIETANHPSRERMEAIEAEVHHDVIAFLSAWAENAGEASRFVHRGMTSSDLLDTATALRMTRAVDVLLERLDELACSVGRRAREERMTVVMGRTHGMYAEPTTVGLKLAGWYAELGRARRRLVAAREVVAVGKLSGAVGTCAHIEPAMEEEVLAALGLAVEPVAGQVVLRDRHAEVATALALLGATLERFALEVRLLQRSEVGEAYEPFGRGQKGSSAMPHKRNPIVCERVCGLARLLRAHALTALENVALWHERDISHSSVERVTLPDGFHLAHYCLGLMVRVVEGLDVRRETMARRVDEAAAAWGSQAVLLALTDAGLARDEAYGLVQGATLGATSRDDVRRTLLADERVAARMTAAELDDCFSVERHTRHVDRLLARAGLPAGDDESEGTPCRR